MAAKGKTAPVKGERTIAELEAELGRRTVERNEALAREAATAEVLQIINASPGDLAPVFNAMLERAIRLCDATQGVLWTIDGDRLQIAATYQVPSDFVELLRQVERGERPIDESLRQIMRGERVVHVADVAGQERYRAGHPLVTASVEHGRVRTLIWVALVKDNAPIGAFAIARREVRPFSDKHIALLQNFAQQAVIAMDNARLLSETREALEQQTATAEVLQVINSSPGDLASVFDAMLEKAMRLCEATGGALRAYDGEVFHAVAMRGIPTVFADLSREVRAEPGTALGRTAAGERVVHVVDLVDPSGVYAGSQLRREMVELGGIRTALWVAMRKEDALLGTFVLYRSEVRAFSDKEIALVENFAAQAVIAMENARLLGELRERTEDLQASLVYQTATSDVLKVISQSTFDLAPVLHTVVETAARLCEAEMAFIFRREGEVYRLTANVGNPPDYEAFLQAHPIAPGLGSITGRVALEGRAVHIIDVASDPEYTLTEAMTLANVHTNLGVPLMREAALIGVITLARQRVEAFTDKQVELVTTFADQAVIAIENARLLGELRQRTEEVAELNRGLEARVAEQVEELGRVGRLKRFLAPQLAELIVSQGDEKILESHRREIVVVFCDLRGYTAFTETAEPEEVLDFLREYHGALGPLVAQFEGTLDQFSGDGIMVFFNDPVPIPDPADRAVRMAAAMREAAAALTVAWRRRGRELGFGAGIAQGYATLGQIGFSERSGYTAIGTVCNVAARLCAEAKDGQVLVSQRVAAGLDGIAVEGLGALALKGLSQPIVAFNVPRGEG